MDKKILDSIDLSLLTDEEFDLLWALQEAINKNNEGAGTFRGLSIEWVECSNPNFIVDANKVKKGRKEDNTNRKYCIRWDGILYKPEDFLKKAFPDYKIFPYKIKPKEGNDKLFYLGKGQRKQLQYDALLYHYLKKKNRTLIAIYETDKTQLMRLCGIYHKSVDIANEWLTRLYYDNGKGIYKMIAFGASIKVDGNNKDIFCYKKTKIDKGAIFTGISMTWEEWIEPIKSILDIARDLKLNDDNDYEDYYDKAIISIYYQNKIYLTLTEEYNNIMRECVYYYFTSGTADFPEGQIPNADLTFTIDFDEDIEIVKSHANAHNKDVKGKAEAYKKFSTLHAAIGDIVTRQQLLALQWNDKNIARYIEYGFMERVSGKKGVYRILIV